jgi:hypothetical protein
MRYGDRTRTIPMRTATFRLKGQSEMFRKLPPLLTIAILLGAVSVPALAQTHSHDVMQPDRYERVSPYAGGSTNYSRANRTEDFLITDSCEKQGYPDCENGPRARSTNRDTTRSPTDTPTIEAEPPR